MDPQAVILGVDTHRDLNVAVALNAYGQRLGCLSVPTTEAGHAQLVAWARGLGAIDRIGIEGTGSFGPGLSRFLTSAGLTVLEVDRPQRRNPRAGKSDPLDAERAARAVLAGEVRVLPKGGDGAVESLRLLSTARRGAIKARTQAANQLHGLATRSKRSRSSPDMPRRRSPSGVLSRCGRSWPNGRDRWCSWTASTSAGCPIRRVGSGSSARLLRNSPDPI